MITATPPSFNIREGLAVGGLQAAIADDSSTRYLVLALPGRAGPCWVCAPASDAALAAVRDGRSSPWNLVHHSCTGTVDIYRTMRDGSLRESVVLCSSLPLGDTLLSAA